MELVAQVIDYPPMSFKSTCLQRSILQHEFPEVDISPEADKQHLQLLSISCSSPLYPELFLQVLRFDSNLHSACFELAFVICCQFSVNDALNVLTDLDSLLASVTDVKTHSLYINVLSKAYDNRLDSSWVVRTILPFVCNSESTEHTIAILQYCATAIPHANRDNLITQGLSLISSIRNFEFLDLIALCTQLSHQRSNVLFILSIIPKTFRVVDTWSMAPPSLYSSLIQFTTLAIRVEAYGTNIFVSLLPKLLSSIDSLRINHSGKVKVLEAVLPRIEFSLKRGFNISLLLSDGIPLLTVLDPEATQLDKLLMYLCKYFLTHRLTPLLLLLTKAESVLYKHLPSATLRLAHQLIVKLILTKRRAMLKGFVSICVPDFCSKEFDDIRQYIFASALSDHSEFTLACEVCSILLDMPDSAAKTRGIEYYRDFTLKPRNIRKVHTMVSSIALSHMVSRDSIPKSTQTTSLLKLGKRLSLLKNAKYTLLKEIALDAVRSLLETGSATDFIKGLEFNREVFEELVHHGYSPRILYGEPICLESTVFKENNHHSRLKSELVTTLKKLSRFLLSLGVRVLPIAGEHCLTETLFLESLSLDVLKSRRAAVVRYISHLKPSNELTNTLNKILLEEQDVYSRLSTSEIESVELVARCRSSNFLETIEAFEHVSGCYNPGGTHVEKPVQIALEANSQVWSMTCGELEVENCEVLLAHQGAIVFKSYGSDIHYSTELSWCGLFCHLLNNGHVPAIVLVKDCPSPRVYKLARGCIEPGLLNSKLTYECDYFDDFVTFYDFKPEKVCGDTLVLTANNVQQLSLLCGNNLPQRSSAISKVPPKLNDLSTILFDGVVDTVRNSEFKQLLTLGRAISNYLRVLIESGVSDRSYLSCEFNFERWNRHRDPVDSNSFVQLESLILSSVNKTIGKLSFSVLLSENPALFFEVKAFLSKSSHPALEKLLCCQNSTLQFIDISALTSEDQFRVLKWAFRNEDHVWRHRGGRPGFERASDFLDFARNSSCFPGFLVLPVPACIPVNNIVLDSALNWAVGYVLGEFTEPGCYEIVTAWVNPEYKGQGIAAQLYTRVFQELSVRGCSSVTFDMLADSWAAASDNIVPGAQWLLRLAKFCCIERLAVSKSSASYSIFNTQTHTLEQFQSITLRMNVLGYVIPCIQFLQSLFKRVWAQS